MACGWRGRAPGYRGAGLGPDEDIGAGAGMPRWEQLGALAPRAQVAGALKLLLHALCSARDAARPVRPESRTARELLRPWTAGEVSGDGAVDGREVGAVLGRIEGVLYGDQALDPDTARELRERCQRLSSAAQAGQATPGGAQAGA